MPAPKEEDFADTESGFRAGAKFSNVSRGQEPRQRCIYTDFELRLAPGEGGSI